MASGGASAGWCDGQGMQGRSLTIPEGNHTMVSEGVKKILKETIGDV